MRSYGHGIIIGHCVFWGKVAGNGHFRKQWGVDALYGLVEVRGRECEGSYRARHYHRALCVLGSNGEWMFREKQWGKGILKKNNGERASWRAQVRWLGEEGHGHGISQGVGRLVGPRRGDWVRGNL